MNKKRLLAAVQIFSLLAIAITLEADTTNMIYPKTHKDAVVEEFHGAMIADPYRWLENPTSDETKKWVAAQQRLTEGFLTSCPARDSIKARITHLMDFKKYSAPFKYGNTYFYWANNGLQNQSVLYRVNNLTDTPTVVIDPNTLSKDGTVSIENIAITKDGSLIASSISTHGSDWKEIKVLNVATGKELPDLVKWCKHTSVSWKHDNSGFYYNRFLEKEGHEEGVYWHSLGTDQSQDQLIYKNQDPQQNHSVGVTEDGNYLLLSTSTGCSEKNNVAFRAIDSQDPFTPIFDAFDSKYHFAGNIGSVFYFLTDKEAPQGRVIMVDVNKGLTIFNTIIPQSENVLDRADIINNTLVCHFMKDAHSVINTYAQDGSLLNTIPLPTIGSASYSGKQDGTELFVTFTSFLYPTTIFSYDFTANTLSKVWDVGVDFKPEPYVTKQIFYVSKDGTKVPMFVTHKKDLQLNSDNPTLLYGYGGFNASMTPFFSVSVVNWLEQGGIFVVANIRGGDEYGSAWHDAGMLDKKQNVFDDFIAAGEWLVSNKYTNPKKLAINGGSNGGLLVGACMQQRPDLFGAVISQVPVTDMLRYHKFTAGRYWVTEYGNVDKLEDFNTMYAYSPLHTVQDGVEYPAVMVTSADTDDRVVPMHSKKWVARLQAASNGKNIVLLRYETAAGHGAGKPTTKVIEENADKYAFLFKIFGMTFKG